MHLLNLYLVKLYDSSCKQIFSTRPENRDTPDQMALLGASLSGNSVFISLKGQNNGTTVE